MREKVEKALEAIRPYLQFDGGDIELLEVTDEGVVWFGCWEPALAASSLSPHPR